MSEYVCIYKLFQQAYACIGFLLLVKIENEINGKNYTEL